MARREGWAGSSRAGRVFSVMPRRSDEADNTIPFVNDFGIGIGGEAIECAARCLDGSRLPSAAEWMRTPNTYRELSSEKFLVT